jgi:hypothetical protein
VLLVEKIEEHCAGQHKEAPTANAWRPCKAQYFQKEGRQPKHQLLWEVSSNSEAGATITDQVIWDVLNKIGKELVVMTMP